MSDSGKPIKLVQRRIALANRVWDVRLDHVRDNEGQEIGDYIAVAPKQPRADLVSGIAVLPVVGDRFGLLRSYRHPLERYIWEIPRGFVDPGEAPAKAALRELNEESGLNCAKEDLIPLGHLFPEASTIAGIAALYAATKCIPSARKPEKELGLGEFHLLAREEVYAMLARFEIEESSTVATLYRYAQLQSSQLR